MNKLLPSSKPDYKSRVSLAVVTLILVGLALRLWGLGFGLPYDFTPDEIHEIVRALKLGTGEYSWTPGKGGLYLLLFVEYGLLYLFWLVTGQVRSPEDFALAYVTDPTAFYILGRLTVVALGILTCLTIYWLCRRLYTKSTALLALTLAVFSHYHVLWSHYINVDIGATLFVWLSVLAYVIYEDENRTRWLLASAVFAGIACAFKLPAAAVVVVLGLAIISKGGKRPSIAETIRLGSVLFGTMLAAILLVAPENVIDGITSIIGQFSVAINDPSAQAWGDFDLSREEDFDNAVHDVTIYTGGTYADILLMDTYLGIVLFSALGTALAFAKRARWEIIFALFFLVFVLVMSLADRPAAERYLLPALPALWILAARGLESLGSICRSCSVVAVAALVSIGLYHIVLTNHMWTRPDTRVLAKQWIEQNVPGDSKVLMDGMRYRFIQSPPLVPNQTAVNRRVGGASSEERLSRGISNRTLDLYAKAIGQLDGPKYDIHSTVWGIGARELDDYVRECFDLVVVSSQNSKRFEDPHQAAQYPISAAFYDGISSHSRFRLVFSAKSEKWKIQGPDIDVYEVDHSCGTADSVEAE